MGTLEGESRRTDVLIVGAGLVGSAVAMHLARLGRTTVTVIDYDLEGSLSSSELNAGGVRATWVQPINVEMSRDTIRYLASIAPEVGYRPCGYLWLHGADRLKRALAASELQQRLGWEVQAWDVAELRRRVPFIDKTDDIAGALFAPQDGLVNSNLLKNHFRAQAREAGVKFVDRTLLRSGTRHAGAHFLSCERFADVQSHDELLGVFEGKTPPNTGKRENYEAQVVVNCAGAWAGEVARRLGYSSPARPVRRQVSIFDSREVDLSPYGMIVDTTGVYFHPEAMNGLAGFAPPDEPPGVNYQYDGESFFQERIWPALFERSSGFEKLKHLTGWSGQYEVSPDECAIIGRVETGEVGAEGAVYEAHSFSGHGVMHCYSAGLALAELITRGRYQTLDVSPLAATRFAAGREIREGLVI